MCGCCASEHSEMGMMVRARWEDGGQAQWWEWVLGCRCDAVGEGWGPAAITAMIGRAACVVMVRWVVSGMVMSGASSCQLLLQIDFFPLASELRERGGCCLNTSDT